MENRCIGLKLQRNLSVLAVFLSLNGCATAEQDLEAQKTFEAHRKIGTGFMMARNYPAAMTELLNAEKLKPNDPEIHNDLALVYFFRDHPIEAERELRTSLKLKPDFTDARNNLGRLYIELAQYSEALAELTRCEQDLTYSAPEKVQYNLALAEYRLGHYADSKEHALRGLARSPKMCESLMLVGESDFQLAKYKNAEGGLARAKANCDVTVIPEIDFYLGLSYFHGGDALKAKSILEEIVQENPGTTYSKRAQSALRIMR